MLKLTNKTSLKVGIASASELKAERDKCILILFHLNKAFPHVHLEPIMWEYDLPKSSNPKSRNLQAAYNATLKECHVSIFLYYSKIGKFTRQEFNLIQKNKIPSFHFFKIGYLAKNLSEKRALNQVIAFKSSLSNIATPIEYNSTLEFEYEFYRNLNLYLAKEYPSGKKLLLTIQQLQGEIKNQEKTKYELESQLNSQIKKSSLKAKALNELRKGNYLSAEKYLVESASDSISDTASTFFELGKIKKLQLLYLDAFNYFELAAKIKGKNIKYLYEAGSTSHTLGLYDKAAEYYRQVLSLISTAKARTEYNKAEIYNDLGQIYHQTFQPNKAKWYFYKALSEFNNSRNKSYSFLGRIYNNLGEVFKRNSNYDKAIKYYEKGLEIDTSFFKKEHPDIAILFNNLGMAHYRKGDSLKALEYLDNALSLDLKFYGKIHPNIAVRYNNIGLIYDLKKSYDIALKYFNKAIILDRKIYGKNHPCLAIRFKNIGITYCHMKNTVEGIKYFEKALKLFHKFLPEHHIEIQETKEALSKAVT